MDNKLKFLQKLLSTLENIRLERIHTDQESLNDLLWNCPDEVFALLIRYDKTLWARLFQYPSRADTIYECVSLGGITYFAHKTPAGQVFLLGPMLTNTYSEAAVQRILNAQHTPIAAAQQVMQICTRLPVIPIHSAYRMADLVIQYLTDTDLTMKVTQIDIAMLPGDYTAMQSELPERHITKMRQTERRYEYSKSLTEAVRQGNLSLALHLIGGYTPASDNPIRNPNPLRNAQNYCIVLNTQLRHALQDTGIHPAKLDEVSNEIGMQIERLNSLSQIPDFTSRVIRRYCELVQESRYEGLKPVTHLAVSYIKEHLSENLTVKEAAEALSVNANYLSALFHADMGMTFIDFVNHERAQQAAALLKHTNLQIQQIATLVGYNNTSYFAKQFKRIFQKSPHDYRHDIA